MTTDQKQLDQIEKKINIILYGLGTFIVIILLGITYILFLAYQATVDEYVQIDNSNINTNSLINESQKK